MRCAHNRPAFLTQNSKLKPQNSRRAGFTLVELLVVIAIIGILVALTAGAVVRFIGVQARDNTEVAMRKIQPLLQNQWKAVIDQAKTEPISQNAMVMAGGDERLARIIHIKLRLRQEFPANYNEVMVQA